MLNFFLLKRLITIGSLRIITSDGMAHHYGQGCPKIVLRFQGTRTIPLFARPDLAVLSAYERGSVKIEHGNLRTLQLLLYTNYEAARRDPWLRIAGLIARSFGIQWQCRSDFMKKLYGFICNSDYRFSRVTRSKGAAHLSNIQGDKISLASLLSKKIRFKVALFVKGNRLRQQQVALKSDAITLPARRSPGNAAAFRAETNMPVLMGTLPMLHARDTRGLRNHAGPGTRARPLQLRLNTATPVGSVVRTMAVGVRLRTSASRGYISGLGGMSDNLVRQETN